MIFIKRTTGDSSIMRFKILDKLNQQKHFFPKFDMPVNTNRDNHINFIRDNDISDHIAMHIGNLV